MAKPKGKDRPAARKRVLCKHCSRAAEVVDATMAIKAHAQRNGSECPGTGQRVVRNELLTGPVTNAALPLKRGRSKSYGYSGQSLRTTSGGLPGTRRGH